MQIHPVTLRSLLISGASVSFSVKRRGDGQKDSKSLWNRESGGGRLAGKKTIQQDQIPWGKYSESFPMVSGISGGHVWDLGWQRGFSSFVKRNQFLLAAWNMVWRWIFNICLLSGKGCPTNLAWVDWCCLPSLSIGAVCLDCRKDSFGASAGCLLDICSFCPKLNKPNVLKFKFFFKKRTNQDFWFCLVWLFCFLHFWKWNGILKIKDFFIFIYL